MEKKSIIVIGGGVAGLAAGCYARMNGYETQIFELHTLPGGLCTSWSRKGYTFDGCIHWLLGSSEGQMMNHIWQELGALKGTRIVNHEVSTCYRDTDGRELILYTDVNRLEKHLLELSPADEKPIREMAETIRKLGKLNLPTSKSGDFLGNLVAGLAALPGMIPILGIFKKYGPMTIENYVAQFSDPLIRKGLVADLPEGFSAQAFLMSMGFRNIKNAGYPLGGSLKFAQAIEKRYLELGGVIHYKARVEKILVEQDRAVGVRLSDGREYRAETIISAADGYATLFKMLEGQYLTDEIRRYYKELPIFRPLVQVSMGVRRDLSSQPPALTVQLKEPITIAGEKRAEMCIKHFCYDPSLAPQGHSSVVTTFFSDHAYWKALAEDPERYEAEKKQIALTVMQQIDRVYPGFSAKVEVVDVATPLTYERYTGNWQGSMEGWLLTKETMAMTMSGKGMSKTLPGLKNFYMVGQWVEPGGGLPPAATSARGVIQRICQADKRKFQVSLA